MRAVAPALRRRSSSIVKHIAVAAANATGITGTGADDRDTPAGAAGDNRRSRLLNVAMRSKTAAAAVEGNSYEDEVSHEPYGVCSWNAHANIAAPYWALGYSEFPTTLIMKSRRIRRMDSSSPRHAPERNGRGCDASSLTFHFAINYVHKTPPVEKIIQDGRRGGGEVETPRPLVHHWSHV